MALLRILHVTPYSADAWAYGGIPRLAATIARGLVRRGHRVTVCTTDAHDAASRLPRRDGHSTRFAAWPAWTHDGVEVRVFPNLSNRLAYHWQAFFPLGLERYMKEHAAGFDVAHLHACRNLPGVVSAHYLRRYAVPYVLAPNGTAPRIERLRLVKRAFDVVFGQQVIHSASRVVAVSRSEQQVLTELGIEARTIALIPNPIDVDEFNTPVERGRFRRHYSLEAHPIVLFLGKITPRKRLDILIRAFAQLDRPDARLVIAGNDMGDGDASRSLAHDTGIADRTIFTGLLTGRDRLDALADANVVVYPSEHEVFGLVPLEALLSGSPVIVADDSGCGEIIRRLPGGQVVPLGSVEALATAIEAVLKSPDAWRARVADSTTELRRAYGQDHVCAQLESLYLEMVA